VRGENNVSEEDLLLQAPTLPVLYFDGFGAFRKMNGLLRCVGFTLELGAQYNVLISLTGADVANRATRAVLDQKPVAPAITMWNGISLPH
jgi:hypothetical protein